MSKNKQAQSIIFCDGNFDDLLLYSIETTFNFAISMVNNWEQFLEKISKQSYPLMVFFSNNDKELPTKINQYFCNQKESGNTINSALIIIGDYQKNDPQIQNLLAINQMTLVQNKLHLHQISKFIISNFVKDTSFIEDEFSPISLRTLMRFKTLYFPVFIKLKTRYLKVLSLGDTFFTDDLEKFHRKGLTHLHLKKRTSKWILKELDNKMDDIIKNPTGTIDMIVPASEVNEDEPAQAQESTVEPTTEPTVEATAKPTAELTPTVVVAKEKREELTIADEFKLTSDTDIISSSIGKPFNLDDNQIEEVKSNLGTIVKVVMKNPEIYKILKLLKINRDKSNYYVSHVGTLINVCTAIASHIDWKTERTIEKLVYACYFHDAGLSEKLELAQIKTEKEAVEKGLSAEDLKLFLSHPTKMAAMLRETTGFPDDVHLIVEQHHEDPKGNGFPKKISSTRIIPLSAVFITSHALVDYMIDNENWDIEHFIEKAKKDLPGNAFRKIFQSLETVKKSM
ncbi:MAG: hypothetical protein HQK49_17540 [Oligoflexia bacterium]|nr:hypothetical protein [Oligoflexia bacterium]